MEHHNVNAVNVYSVDEEKLKFRIIIAIDGEVYRQAPGGVAPAAVVIDGDGAYEIDIPIPTSIANSEKYNQCLIKCDAFAATAGPTLATPTWARAGAAAGVGITAAAFELQLSVGSGQTSTSAINAALGNPGDRHEPVIAVSGYRQLIPGQIVSVGNALTFSPIAAGFGWIGMMRDLTPLLCSNPFGQRMRVRIVDPLSRQKACIMDSGGLANGDRGKYFIQLDVTMVPNKQGC
tara:strand:- start:1441 stop:2142 length:702 start_codon:yes stop_codon:yes gene_type:complete